MHPTPGRPSIRSALRIGPAATLIVLAATAAPTHAQCNPREIAKLTDNHPAQWDRFGYAVAVGPNVILVGAPGHEPPDNNGSGTAYAYKRIDGRWAKDTTLLPSGVNWFVEYGCSAAIDADSALIGATIHNEAFLFVRSGDAWLQESRFAGLETTYDNSFGASVAIDGDTAVVGDPGDCHDGLFHAGAVYVFVRSNGTWTMEAKLTSIDARARDRFGCSVAIDGETILVGAEIEYHGVGGEEIRPGAAYVFVRNDGVWSRQARLSDATSEYIDYFGTSVALEGDTALVGAPWINIPQGAAYMFKRSNDVWTLQQQLAGSNVPSTRWFGVSVSLSGDTALIGAHQEREEGTGRRGAAYVFRSVEGTWVEAAKLRASDGTDEDSFGLSVAIHDDTAVIGSYVNNHSGVDDAGAAYVYDLHCQHPIGDLNCDTLVDLFDIEPYLLALTSAAEDPPFASYRATYPGCAPSAADINADGNVDTLDIDAFVHLLTDP